MKNQYKSFCKSCGTVVFPGDGEAVKVMGAWSVFCQTHVPATPPPVTVKTLDAQGVIRTPYDPALVPQIRAMPGAWWDAEARVWRVSTKVEDRDQVLALADRIGLQVDPSLRVIPLPQHVQNRMKTAELAGLFPYQVEGVKFLSMASSRALLADDQGTGKTIQVLMSLPENARALVVVPASVKLNWWKECRKWRPDLAPVVLNGKGAFRFPDQDGEVVIVNPDIIPEGPHEGGSYDPHPEVILVADEAHMYKNFKTGRAKKMGLLTESCGKVFPLTGTPLLGKPLDLWGVLSTFRLEEKVFGSFSRFFRLFNAVKDGYGTLWGKPEPEVYDRLRRVMLRRTKAEVLPELPDKTFQVINVGKPSARLATKLDKLVAEYENGLPPFEKMSEVRAALATAKIEAMEEIVESYEDSGTPLVVFSDFKAPIETLASREGWMVITGETSQTARNEAVTAFQSGKLKGIGLTIAAGGVGLTLTHASHMLFVDQNWTPAMNVQAQDRIHRIGQKNACHYMFLVMDHSLEERMSEVLSGKQDLISRVVG